MDVCHGGLRMICLFGLVLVMGPAMAWAHIDIEPKETIPGRWETFVLNVPTETGSPTVEVQLDIPEGFEVEAVGHRTDWEMALRRDERGFVRAIVWSGGQIPPLTFEEFKLLAKASKAPGSYDWQARQRYAADQESTWTMRTIVREQGNGLPSQKGEEALKTAQVAMTISFLAVGVATVLIVVTLITIWQGVSSEETGRRVRLFIEYFSTLLHLIGLLILAGGHLWWAVSSVKAEQSPFDYGQRFLLELLPAMSTFFGVGVLLLFSSGMAKLVLWYEPGFIFLPLPYGWILLTKLILYTIIVVNGMVIERRHIARLIKLGLPEVGDCISSELADAWAALQRQARVNFALIMVVVALGETLRFAKMS